MQQLQDVPIFVGQRASRGRLRSRETLGFATPRLARFTLENPHFATPYLVVDLDVVIDRYIELLRALPNASIFYAVKANPAPEVLAQLKSLGSSFDVASLGEIRACLDLGIDPAHLSFGNTIKKLREIEVAYKLGVRTFTTDSLEDLGKLTQAAPGSTVVVRLASAGEGADWPLTGKFGCSTTEAVDILCAADAAGHSLGMSVHVGSQQRNPQAWDSTLADVALVLTRIAHSGRRVSVINLGGGFPSHHLEPTPDIEAYSTAILASVAHHLAPWPEITYMVEPGRYLVGDAGYIETEVIHSVSRTFGDARRWVYLDAGVFTGLVETQEEAIRYRLTTEHDDAGSRAPTALAGPTCDSLDVLYSTRPYMLPDCLAGGDRLHIHSAGAYTATYSTVGFNGFDPLKQFYVGGSYADDNEGGLA